MRGGSVRDRVRPGLAGHDVPGNGLNALAPVLTTPTQAAAQNVRQRHRQNLPNGIARFVDSAIGRRYHLGFPRPAVGLCMRTRFASERVVFVCVRLPLVGSGGTVVPAVRQAAVTDTKQRQSEPCLRQRSVGVRLGNEFRTRLRVFIGATEV